MGRHLTLKDLDTGCDEIDDLELEIRHDLFNGYYYFETVIGASDINCRNEEKILDAISRRAEKYFDDVTVRPNYIKFKRDLPATAILGRTKMSKIPEVRRELKKDIQNTLDDVFGVSCV